MKFSSLSWKKKQSLLISSHPSDNLKFICYSSMPSSTFNDFLKVSEDWMKFYNDFFEDDNGAMKNNSFPNKIMYTI